MNMYGAILLSETEHIKQTYQVVLSHLPHMLPIVLELSGRDVDRCYSGCKLLLNSAQQLNNIPSLGVDLDAITSEFDRIHGITSDIEDVDPELLRAIKQRLELEVQLYQRLLSHEGYAHSYGEAVRREFRSREAFEEVLRPMQELDLKIFDFQDVLHPEFGKLSLKTGSESETMSLLVGNKFYQTVPSPRLAASSLGLLIDLELAFNILRNIQFKQVLYNASLYVTNRSLESIFQYQH